jgi:hypothetical protein
MKDNVILCRKKDKLILKNECLYKCRKIEQNDKTCLQSELNLETLKELLNLDTLLKGEEAQKTYLQWVQQKLPEKEGLKWLRENRNSLLGTEPFSLFDDYLDDIAKEAIFNGFVPLFSLIEIMASEEDYTEVLPILWEFHERNDRTGIEIQTKTHKDRAFPWLRFFAE